MSDFDERLQRYIAGEMTAEDRIAFEDEVLSNAEIVDRLYEDASLRAVLETVGRARREREVAAAPAVPWWRRWAGQWLVPAAAVAAVAILMFTQKSPEQPPVFRGADGHLEGVEPMGEVGEVPSRFVWTASEGAAWYRFELFDATSTPVFDTVTADTIFTIEAITLRVPARGYWVVTPLNDLRARTGGPVLIRYHTAD